MKKCLIFLDSEQIQNSIELLEVVHRMYPYEQWEAYGAAINYSPLEAQGYFDFIIQVHARSIKQYNVKEITNAISDIHKQYSFDVILIPATWCGRILAPRLAVKLQTGLTADVTEIHYKEDAIEMVRPVFGSRMMACIVNKSNGPVMMSVRQNVFKYNHNINKQTQFLEFDYLPVEEAGIRQVCVHEKIQSHDIRESSILVSGGGGVGKNFYRLESLAEVLNGHVAASRRIVDKGIAPRSIQVGQSGKTVSPKLYMALGIYGAIQHVEGLKNVECIISVNTNTNAPICSLSDIVVEGDALLFADLLTERIRSYQNEKKIINNMEENTMKLSDFNMDYFSLKGKNAIVTGGNGGLGQAFTTALAKAGANVLVPSLADDDGSTRALVEACGVEYKFMIADITADGECKKIVDECVNTWGSIDILINCAGISINVQDVTKYTRNEWDKMISINLTAAFEMIHEASKYMIKQESGKIINIGSLYSFLGGQWSPAYAATKHGIVGLTKAMCDELAQWNIQVNAIAPGYYATPMTEMTRKNEKRNAEILAHIPANRWGYTADLMGATIFLASRASDYVNGTTLTVDGGYLMR